MIELIWIAVPGGAARADGRSPLAVVIVPRLTGDGGDLASHGMDRWPELLRRTRVELEVRSPGHETTFGDLQPEFDAPVDVMLAHWRSVFVTTPKRKSGVEPASVRATARHDALDIQLTPTTAEVTGVLALYASDVSGQDPSVELAALAPLLQRRADTMSRRASDGARDSAADTLDFHRLVALYREHPRVLRALGLIVDLALDLPADVEAVRVSPALPPWPVGSTPTSSRPWTRCSSTGGRLVATPRPGSVLTRGGLVDFGGAGPVGASHNPHWAIVTFDVDGAMTHLPAAGDEPELAGLRSAGLGLVRTGREADLHDRAGRSAAPGSADGADVFADDLLLGYRLDVRDEQVDRWSPLCARRARYEIAGQPLDPRPIDEEGHVKPDALIMDPSGALAGDELIARWDGWSLAVPRPVPGGAARGEPATAVDWRFEVVPPLPRLRFGHAYRLRARATDLAGGGLTVADLGDEPKPLEATEPVFYGRVEPIPAPVVLVAEQLGPGEALQRMVVRSLGGPPPAPPDPDVPDLFPPPDPPPDPYPSTVARLLAAPPVSVELAEQHGVFDGLTPEQSWELARRAMPELERARAAAGDRPPRPLPDPLAHDWYARAPSVQPVHHEWPAAEGGGPFDPAPVRLTLRRGESVALFPDGAGAIVVLPPAGQLTLSVSSAPDRAGLNQLALPRWVEAHAAGGVGDAVLAGDHPHITPARALQLVHAVQRPLAVPRGSVGADRRPGDTSVTVTRAGLDVDRASTGQVDIAAFWREWGDAPAPIGPRSAFVTSLTVPLTGAPDPLVRHELGDTRRRTISYVPTAISRFQEYFDPALLEADPAAFSVTGPAMVVDVPSSARPAAPAVRYTVPAFAWGGAAPAPGWRQWRHVRRGGLARVHMGPGWFSSGEGELLGLVVSNDAFAPPRLWPFLSEAGRDPTKVTVNPIHLLAASDAGRTAGQPAEVFLPEANGKVTVVPFAPWPDPAGAGWLADIDLGPLADISYCPFVELALCRYQPVSIERCCLSQVVRTDLLQLLPSRQLSVRREGDTVAVTLEGIGPGGVQTANLVEVWVERWSDPAGGPPTTDFTSLEASSDVAAWMRVAEPARGALGQEIVVSTPADPAPRRVLIRETEPERFGVTPPTAPPLRRELGQRVVFADVVRLD